MSSFTQLAALPGVGVAYLLHASDDGFATVDYRYSTVGGYFGQSLAYDARIVSIGDLTRGFGPQGSISSATVDVVLDNTDAGADQWVDSSWETVDSYEWRLLIALYDPSNPSDYAVKSLGTFGIFDPPVRTTESIALSLSDSTSARAEAILRAPSLADWAGVTDASRPAYDEASVDAGIDYDEPLPIRFGHDRHPLLRMVGEKFVLCASRSLTSESYVTNVYMRNGADITETALFRWVKETTTEYDPETYTTYEITTGVHRIALPVSRSSTITVGGYDWTIRWIDLTDLAWYIAAAMREQPSLASGLADGVAGRLWEGGERAIRALDELGLTFRCAGLSETQDSGFFPRVWDAGATAYSILSDYTSLGPGRVDMASFKRASGARGLMANGSISASVSRSDMDGVRISETTGAVSSSAIGSLCVAGGFDISSRMDGTVKATNLAADYHALDYTPITIDETQVSNISDRVAGRGERWAPFGSVYVKKHGKTFGPYSNSLSSVQGGRAAITLDAAWVGNEDLACDEELGFVRQDARRLADVAFGGQYAATKRTIVSFTAWLEHIGLELGDFFFFSWTRGGRGTPYDNDLFMVESIVFSPESCTMRIEAVYCADFPGLTRWPSLMDNEDLLVRGSGTLGGVQVGLTDGSDTVQFFTTTPTAPTSVPTGTSAGDILRLSSETVRARARDLRILSVASTYVTVESGDLDFDAGGGLYEWQWHVIRGKSTMPTSVDDPVNYPSGGLPYVGVADSTDNRYSSDAENAHPLGA